MDLSILSRLLNAFIFVLSGGYARILPEALWLLQRLAIIEIVLLGAWWALGNEEGIAKLIKLTLWFGLLLWFLTSWPTISDAILKGLIQVGLDIGGTPMSTAEFLNPSGIMAHGMRVIGVIFTKLTSYSGLGAVMSLPQLFIMGLAAIGIWLAFFVLAAQVFVKILEFYIAAVVVVILLPFGALRHTAFLCEKAFGVVIGTGISLSVLAVVESLILPVFVTLQIGAEPSLYDAFTILTVAGIMGILAWQAPALAAGIMSGAPSLTAATMAQGAVALAATTALGAAGVDRAARGLMAMTQSATQGGAALRTALQQGGMQGVQRLAERAGADLVGPTIARFQDAVRAGSAYGQGAVTGQWSMRQVRSGSGSMGAPAWARRMAHRAIPPQAHPSGGVHVPLD